MSDGEEDKTYYGPERPPHMIYSSEVPAWDFEYLDNEAGSDTGSTTANVDNDEDGDARMGDTDGYGGNEEWFPENPYVSYPWPRDDNDLDDGMLHLENAVGEEVQSNASTAEVDLPSDEPKLD